MFTFLRYRAEYRAHHPDCATRDCNTYALARLYSETHGRACEEFFRMLNNSTRKYDVEVEKYQTGAANTP